MAKSINLCPLILALLLAAPVFGQQYPIHFVNAFKQAQEKRMAADAVLLENMEDAAEWLSAYRKRHGHMPELGLEQERAIKAIQTYMQKPNPYSVTGIQSDAERKPCALRFVEELSLNEVNRQQWQKQAPSSWRAEPGTITILWNGFDNLLLWGAGADRQPIFDGKSNSYAFAWRRYIPL
ncbi:MAG: hypothetical protein K2X27_04420 [Candidatus Obscuribacterales bacterium]|nr:hypothetical protein [Candidatus Obscuribacterales bacterium]